MVYFPQKQSCLYNKTNYHSIFSFCIQGQQFKDDSELTAAEDSKQSAGSSPSDTELSLGDETLTVTTGSSSIEDVELSVLTDGSNVSSGGEQFLDKARKQATQRRLSRIRNNRVLPTECGNVTHFLFSIGSQTPVSGNICTYIPLILQILFW